MKLSPRPAAGLAAWLSFLGLEAPSSSAQTLSYSIEGTSYFGVAVSVAGDIDQDGCDDFLVGDFAEGASSEGSVTLYSGKSGAALLTLTGNAYSKFGCAVDGEFDADGDGFLDLLIGSEADSTAGPSRGRVVVYSPHLQATLWDLQGPSDNAKLGHSARALGDVDKDGSDDFIAGAYGVDTVYVYSGATGTPLFTKVGQSGSAFGFAVSRGGKINGDAYLDFLVGAPIHNDASRGHVGRVIAFSGKDGTKLWSVDGSNTGSDFGFSIAHPGDLDGDSRGDCVVGAWVDSDPGGSETGSATVISGKTGTVSYVLYGDGADDIFGWAVRGAGDIDGDGLRDFVVGAPGRYSNLGYVRAFSGSGAEIFTYRQVTSDPLGPGDDYGSAVASGDFDGDGRTDVVIGNDLFALHGIVEVRTTAVASSSNYGKGWPGTLGVPTITASNVPVVGQPIDVGVSNSAGVITAGLLCIGLASASSPTSKGGTLLVDPLVWIPLAIPVSGITLSGTIPADPALYGVHGCFQALEADLGASAKLSFTDGLDLRFGFN